MLGRSSGTQPEYMYKYTYTEYWQSARLCSRPTPCVADDLQWRMARWWLARAGEEPVSGGYCAKTPCAGTYGIRLAAKGCESIWQLSVSDCGIWQYRVLAGSKGIRKQYPWMAHLLDECKIEQRAACIVTRSNPLHTLCWQPLDTEEIISGIITVNSRRNKGKMWNKVCLVAGNTLICNLSA